jgi:integrase
MKIESRGAVSFAWLQAKQIADEVYELDVDGVLKERYATVCILAAESGLRCAELFALRINDLDCKAGTMRRCTGSRLMVYNQHPRAKSGRRTMAV